MPLSNPVSPVSTQNQDFHSRMDENSTNMHLPKGMRLADNGTNVVKYASGDVQYIPINPLPAALDFADSSIAPVTEVDGDIYILDTSLSSLTVTDIAWQSGTTVRISFSGSPDLSATTVNDYFIISTASNDSNNGRFILSDVNDGSDFIEIENTSRTDATDDETSISIASNIGFRDWDGAINNEWVTFNSVVGEWQRIVPEEGLNCFIKSLADTYTFIAEWNAISLIQLGFAVSDEDTDLEIGTSKLTLRMPYKATLVDVRANVKTAPTGSTIVVDINESGSTVLSTKLTIDATEKTSTTAATPHVISDSALADDSEITIDIDQIGSTIAGTGLKIWLYVKKA